MPKNKEGEKHSQASVRRICLFGLPGSGKTVTSKLLGETFPDMVLIEASRDIIRPLAQIKRLPDDIQKLISRIVDYKRAIQGQDFNIDVLHRIYARTIFDKLSQKYGREWVALVIEALRANIYPDKDIGVSGVRGIENARLLASLGYKIIYLKAPLEILASRQACRESQSITTVLHDQKNEEQMYRTSEIEQVANLVIDVAQHSMEQVVRIILEEVC